MKRILPAVVFIIVIIIGVGITWIVFQAIWDTAQSEFKSDAQGAVDRVTSRVEQHVSLLVATQAFLVANRNDADRRSYSAFVGGLDIERRYSGIQGIGYAPMHRVGNEGDVEAVLRGGYDIDRGVWPEVTDEKYRTPIMLLEPLDARNGRALGYDMFSDRSRRDAMVQAMENNAPTASAPVELVQEITSLKQTGFLIYLPLFSPENASEEGRIPAGFVYAPFRAGDLHAAALEASPVLPVVMRTYDVSGEAPSLLYESPSFEDLISDNSMTAVFDTDVVGRKWRFEVSSIGPLTDYADFLPIYALAAVLIVLAGSLAAGTRWQHRAVETAVALNETSIRSLAEKELLVQEMRHRIKNSISRVMAIARQTASSTKTMEDFNASFSARLGAMANAQDLLARSHWGRANLSDLLKAELGQVFGDNADAYAVGGPNIELNERATQALGLVFHELATNALKYSGVADGEAELSVRWGFEGRGDNQMFTLRWVEKGNVVDTPPDKKGFGSRLMDASVRGELQGEIERRYDADGMTVLFKIPASRVA